MKTTWTFGDEKWRIVSEPTKDNISHLKLYADDELVFEGRYGELIKLIKNKKDNP
jgi:hypothetical protein